MTAGLRTSLRLSFVASEAELPVPPVSELLAQIRSTLPWDVASIHPAAGEFPRLHVDWHDGQGFTIQCFEDDQSWGYFVVTSSALSHPDIEINLGGQTLERWPRELFVSESVAHQALECFLDCGKQDPALHWIRMDAFPRETLWEGRQGREAWERAQAVNHRDV